MRRSARLRKRKALASWRETIWRSRAGGAGAPATPTGSPRRLPHVCSASRRVDGGDIDGTQRLQLVDDAIAAAAKQLNVALRSHGDVCAEALSAIGRVEEEIAKLQRAGGLKSVNKSYRDYRIAASARGEQLCAMPIG